MKVQDIMTRHVECVTPETSLRAAAQKMKELDVGPLPVCDNDRIAGVVTDRDIAIRGVAAGLDPETTTVREVMSSGAACCFEDDDIEEAEAIMQEKQIRRLMVLNRDNRLVGILSLGDLAVRTHGNSHTAETLEEISKPVH